MEIQHIFYLLVSLTVSTSLVSARVFGGLFQNVSPCKTGEKVSCMVPPCAASKGCNAFPNAECKNDYCGGCHAKFYDGQTEVTAQCDGKSGDVFAQSRIAASDSCAPVRCFMNPCDKAKCDAKPSAACKQHKCECSATFWEGNTEVTNQCTVSVTDTRALLRSSNAGGMMSSTECGDQLKVHCHVSPCDVETCPEFPGAQCRTNYCGGCSAEFWVGSKDVTSQCKIGDLLLNTGGGLGPVIASRKAPQQQPQIPEIHVDPTRKPCLSSCFFPPCRFSYCAAFPNAECRDNYCDGCRATYYMGDTNVTSMCNDRVPTMGRLFSGGRRRPRMRSFFSPWMALLDGMF